MPFPTRHLLAGALLSSSVLLAGMLPAGAAPGPASTPAPQASAAAPAWSAPRLSVHTPAAQLVAEGAAQPGARTASGQLQVLSVRAVDGRPQVTTKLVSGQAAAVREVTARQQDPGVVSVEIAVPRQLTLTPAPSGDAPAQTSALATDPYRDEQWGLDRIGAEQVWPSGNGRGVVIAVIDTGVDATHPDLAGRVLPGAAFPADGLPGSFPVAEHGTHVAGIAAASANNGIGIAGVASGATILPVRAFNEAGRADVQSLVDSIVYATDQGADVINMSYSAGNISDAEAAAIAYARSKGVFMAAAGGNSGRNQRVYPAALDGVVGVGNEDPSGGIDPSSTNGTHIDISAPGTDILSTMPDGHYDYMTGTSMATPAVSGVAALLLSARPGLTPEQVEQAMTATAVDLQTPGYDLYSGFGQVTAPAALAKTGCLLSGECVPAQNLFTTNKNQAVVNRAFVGLLGRNASGADLVNWDARLLSGTSPGTMSQALTSSEEFRRRVLQGAYQQYLQRGANASEMSSWLTAMRSGWTQPQVEAGFLASPEFYNLGGGTDAGFVTRLYQSVLGRSPASAEVSYWTGVLGSGRSRYDVALGFTASAEYQGTRVDRWFQTLIGRAPSPAERSAAVTRLISGGRIENEIAVVVGGYEFNALSGQRFGSTGLGIRRGN